EVLRRAGRPRDARGRGERGHRDDRGRVRAVPAPGGLPPAHPARPDRDRARVQAPRDRRAAAGDVVGGPCDRLAACDNGRMTTDETSQSKSANVELNPIVSDAEKQEKVLNALQAVLDPEIGLSVIDLDLIREVVFTPRSEERRV